MATATARRWSVLPCLFVLSGACAPSKPPAFAEAVAHGDRAESAGRFEEAAGAYEEAARTSVKPHDADHARFLAATMRVRAGDYAGAHDRFAALAAAPGEYQAQATYEAADLEIAHGDPDAGFEALKEYLHRFSGDGLARRALDRLLARAHERGGDETAIAFLDDERRRLAGTGLEADVLYRLGRAYEERRRAGDEGNARDLYLEVAARWPYPVGAYFDDSLFRAAEIDASRGRPVDAARELERLLAERETTTLTGSYERPRYVPAMFKLAALYRGDLRDHRRARAVYRRLYSEFAHSAFRDDALWQEATLAARDGDASGACSALGLLTHEFPDSRYVPCAIERCRLARPSKSHAPRTCHGYIERGDAPDPARARERDGSPDSAGD